MLINQIDTKQTGKFCKNFISKIYQCIENFSLIEVVGRLGMGYPLNGTMGDGTQSAPSHCPPGYTGLLASRSKQVTKIV